MSDEDVHQRRKNKRYKVNWGSRLLLPGKRIVASRVRDVSSGGVCFEYDQQLPVGQEVNIEMNPMIKGKPYSIRAKGVVTFNMILSGNNGFSHGLKFTFVPKEQFEHLAEIISGLETG